MVAPLPIVPPLLDAVANFCHLCVYHTVCTYIRMYGCMNTYEYNTDQQLSLVCINYCMYLYMYVWMYEYV